MPYVDVRGFHPVLVQGLKTTTLRDAPRSITVEEALQFVTK